MRIISYLIAVIFGKAIMVFYVSYIGHDIRSFVEHPIQLVYVLLFIGASLFISKKIESYFTRVPLNPNDACE